MVEILPAEAQQRPGARANMSEDVANRLRDMIFDGHLVGGQRINEVHLSRELGVSRTPLREALTMLVAEEALVSVPRRGCFVRPLSRVEFEEIYPMRSILDPEALKLSGVPGAARFDRLRRINDAIRTAEDMRTRMSLDDRWHLELVAGCGNRVLLDLIRHFMRRFRRYGLAFAREQQVLETANHEHVEILRSLERGDLHAACDWLRGNLSSNKEPILAWLEERKDEAIRQAI